MSRRAWVLAFALIPAAAGRWDRAVHAPSTPPDRDAPRRSRARRSSSASTSSPSRPFLLPVLDLSDLPEEKRLFHQAGDPDSLFTLGDPTPEGQLHLKAAIELNEIHLKAIPPDASQGLGETRPRAAGSFLPLDASGRPYQLRLGARLVW